jgi:hypothetical protein
MGEISKPIASSKRIAKLLAFGFCAPIILLGAAIYIAPDLSDLLGLGGAVKRVSPLETQAYLITKAIYEYADGHEGHFPPGKSSTEVFQHLLDGGYVRDPSLFWLQLPGKKKPTESVLRPENVSWDVSSPMTAGKNKVIPILFITGYKFHYTLKGTFTPLFKTPEGRSPDFVWGFLYSYDLDKQWLFLHWQETRTDPRSGSLPYDWCSDDSHWAFYNLFFDSSQEYQQLTPDGPLGP